MEKAIKKETAQLILIAEDASDNTKKKFSDMAGYRGIPLLFFGTKESLGLCMGETIRASAAVTDAGLAAGLEKKIRAANAFYGQEVGYE